MWDNFEVRSCITLKMFLLHNNLLTKHYPLVYNPHPKPNPTTCLRVSRDRLSLSAYVGNATLS